MIRLWYKFRLWAWKRKARVRKAEHLASKEILEKGIHTRISESGYVAALVEVKKYESLLDDWFSYELNEGIPQSKVKKAEIPPARVETK